MKARLDLGVSDLGQIQLKNVAEPIRVYALQVELPLTAARDASRARTEVFEHATAARQAFNCSFAFPKYER